ncbi:hypothetical protein H5410_052157, partial [Solanum commersonii]
MSIAYGIQGQLLEVTVVACNKLKDTEWISRKNPTFQEKFVFTLIEGLREINVVVWNSNTVNSDDLIGSGKFSHRDLMILLDHFRRRRADSDAGGTSVLGSEKRKKATRARFTEARSEARAFFNNKNIGKHTAATKKINSSRSVAAASQRRRRELTAVAWQQPKIEKNVAEQSQRRTEEENLQQQSQPRSSPKNKFEVVKEKPATSHAQSGPPYVTPTPRSYPYSVAPPHVASHPTPSGYPAPSPYSTAPPPSAFYPASPYPSPTPSSSISSSISLSPTIGCLSFTLLISCISASALSTTGLLLSS